MTSNLTAIGVSAFANCKKLSSIEIPTSVTTIGAGAFAGCTGFTSFDIPTTISKLDSYLFSGCTGLTSIDIPSNITSIESRAFEACTGLTTVTFPSTLTKIGQDAFIRCTGLTSIEIPNSVATINDGAFNGCTNLASANIPTSLRTIPPYLFYECKKLTSIVIPEGVTSIGNVAFEYCHALATVELPSTLQTIGTSAFECCYALPSLEIPNSVTTIGRAAFAHCTSMTSLTIGSGVANIPWAAFEDCSKLTSLTLGVSVSNIEDRGFNQCSALTDIISLASTPPTIINSSFGGVDKTQCVVRVPTAYVDDYREASIWQDFSIIPFTNTVTFEDGTIYANTVPYTIDELVYSRTFTNTNWQPLYVPFSLDVVADLGEDYTVAEINGVHQFDMDGDGDFDETWIEFRTVKSGETRPNTPYVIKAAEAGEKTISLTNKTLCAAATNSVDCSTSRHLYTLTGTYSEIADIKGKYAMKGGEFAPGTQGVNTIKPQRIYLEISERDGGYGTTTAPAQMPARVRVMVDGQATSIEGITTDLPTSAAPMYNLHGVRVGSGYKGIVIQNGKKILKR